MNRVPGGVDFAHQVVIKKDASDWRLFFVLSVGLLGAHARFAWTNNVR